MENGFTDYGKAIARFNKMTKAELFVHVFGHNNKFRGKANFTKARLVQLAVDKTGLKFDRDGAIMDGAEHLDEETYDNLVLMGYYYK